MRIEGEREWGYKEDVKRIGTRRIVREYKLIIKFYRKRIEREAINSGNTNFVSG